MYSLCSSQNLYNKTHFPRSQHTAKMFSRIICQVVRYPSIQFPSNQSYKRASCGDMHPDIRDREKGGGDEIKGEGGTVGSEVLW